MAPWDARIPRSVFRNTIILNNTASPVILFSVPNNAQNRTINTVQKDIVKRILNK